MARVNGLAAVPLPVNVLDPLFRAIVKSAGAAVVVVVVGAAVVVVVAPTVNTAELENMFDNSDCKLHL